MQIDINARVYHVKNHNRVTQLVTVTEAAEVWVHSGCVHT